MNHCDPSVSTLLRFGSDLVILDDGVLNLGRCGRSYYPGLKGGGGGGLLQTAFI